MTAIEWTDATWNPTRGCSRVSPGCVNCYAERVAMRFSGEGQPYAGLAKLRGGRPGWTGKVRLVPEMLARPLHWRKPRQVFVNSMSDLFHEALSDEEIAAVVGVMAACPQHSFQVLTKRAERMLEWYEWVSDAEEPHPANRCVALAEDALRDWRDGKGWWNKQWPLTNVWLGVSVEDQECANERIPHLLDTPAAVRFLSCEPLLGPIDLTPWLPSLDWVIVGGESGPDARPCEVEWVRALVRQCREANVACFVKQLGARVHHVRRWEPPPLRYERLDLTGCAHAHRILLRHPKGGDPREWPEDLRVREYPTER